MISGFKIVYKVPSKMFLEQLKCYLRKPNIFIIISNQTNLRDSLKTLETVNYVVVK